MFASSGMAARAVNQGSPSTWVERTPNKRLMLFSGRSNPELGERIAEQLGVSLAEVTLKTFTNGEVYARYEESIRGADVFLVQSCSTPTERSSDRAAGDGAGGTVASAKRVTAVLPWYPYARQDKNDMPASRFRPAGRRSARAAGVCRVLTIDLHVSQIQGFFTLRSTTCRRCRCLPTLQGSDLRRPGRHRRVAGDAGRTEPAKKFSEMLGGWAGDHLQGTPRSAGRDRHRRHRPRQGQDLHRDRRHDRHRRHPMRRRRVAVERGATGSTPARPTRCSPDRRMSGSVERLQAGRGHRHDPRRPDPPTREGAGAVGRTDPG